MSQRSCNGDTLPHTNGLACFVATQVKIEQTTIAFTLNADWMNKTYSAMTALNFILEPKLQTLYKILLCNAKT